MVKEMCLKASYYTELSRDYFNNWRFFRLLSALSGAVAIVPAMIDYELSYSASRTISTCMINYQSNIYRFLCLLLSLLAIALLVPYRLFYLKWLKNLPLTFKEFPPTHKISVLEVMEMQRKRKVSDHFFEGGTLITLIIFLIFPYPLESFTFSIRQQFLYESQEVCYYYSEIFLSLMIFRVAILALASLNYGKYQSEIARSSAEKYAVKITPSFSIKCYLRANAMPALFFFLLVPGVLVFGYLLRIFERPLTNYQDFDSLENCCWNIIITMTTVGYGDTFASSIIGRLVVVFSIFWGGIILSLTFVTVGGVLQLKNNEKKAYESINVCRNAADAINLAVALNQHQDKSKSTWGRVSEKLRMFSEKRNVDTCLENYVIRTGKFIDGKIEVMGFKADRLCDKLKKFKDSLDH